MHISVKISEFHKFNIPVCPALRLRNGIMTITPCATATGGWGSGDGSPAVVWGGFEKEGRPVKRQVQESR